MKKFIYLISALFMVCLIGAVAHAEMVIEIEAHIDGLDRLIIKGDTLQWHHLEFEAVGRHDGANSPTIIYTTENGSAVADARWLPDWPKPPPDPISFEAFSSEFSELTPAFPAGDVPWNLTKLFGRGEVNIVVQPNPGNDFTLVVEFDDTAFAGSRFYGIRLNRDGDDDGIPGIDDACPDSDLSATVVIDGCYSEVENTLFDNGCTIADLVMKCAEASSNHGKFNKCVAGFTKKLKKRKIITGQEKGAIQSCAGQADIP